MQLLKPAECVASEPDHVLSAQTHLELGGTQPLDEAKLAAYYQSMFYFGKSCEIYTRVRDSLLESEGQCRNSSLYLKCTHELWQIALQRRDLAKELEFCEEYLQLIEVVAGSAKTVERSDIYSQAGLTYKMSERYDKAIECYEKAS